MTIADDINKIVDLLIYSGNRNPKFTTIIYDESDPARPPSAPYFKYSQSIEEMQRRKLLKIITINHNDIPVGEFDTRLRQYLYYKVQCSLNDLECYKPITPAIIKNNQTAKIYQWQGRTFKFLFKDGVDQPITFELKSKEGERKGQDLIIYHTFRIMIEHWESVGEKKIIPMEEISDILKNKGFKGHRTSRDNISSLMGGIRTKISSNGLENNIVIWFNKKLDGYFIKITQT